MGAWIEIIVSKKRKALDGSHPIWVRGLKYTDLEKQAEIVRVAPHMGAWIEIIRRRLCLRPRLVAPHMGAWIEISHYLISLIHYVSHPIWVRGLKCSGAITHSRLAPSHPIWVRGLKLANCKKHDILPSRTPYGCVD